MTDQRCTVCKYNWGLAPFVAHIKFCCPRCGLQNANPSLSATNSRTLESLLNRDKCLAVAKSTRIFVNVMEVLESAHALGRIHGHLRPKLVSLNDDDSLSIVAAISSESLLAVPLAEPESSFDELFLPIEYLSPELMLARTSVDQRVDVYALGALLFHMFAGVPPIVEGHILSEKMLNILRGRVGLNASSEVPSSLIDLCAKALAAKVEDRFRSVKEFRQEFQSIANFQR